MLEIKTVLMKIKNIILVLVGTLLLAIFLQSCTKYESGVSWSLLSPEKRISRDWYLNFAKVNGEVVDPAFVEWLVPKPDTVLFVDFDSMLSDDQKLLLTVATLQEDGDGKFYFFSNIPSVQYTPIKYFSWSFDIDARNIILSYQDNTFTLEIIKLTKKELTLRRTYSLNGIPTITELEFISTKLEEEESQTTSL